MVNFPLDPIIVLTQGSLIIQESWKDQLISLVAFFLPLFLKCEGKIQI
jgi:hypothetical protein